MMELEKAKVIAENLKSLLAAEPEVVSERA
ncbi:hypothetical protein LCGC14_1218670 [marine sediment metagenome]|uniref:Uncharacterized protein n=1 Tax=marine sediment metagenome TaxID=412755 RepID=A0A0F9LBZ6_9ZZZZ